MRVCDVLNLFEVDEVTPGLCVTASRGRTSKSKEEENGRLNPAILETPACLKIQSAYKLSLCNNNS